jgi:hypothetical protein
MRTLINLSLSVIISVFLGLEYGFLCFFIVICNKRAMYMCFYSRMVYYTRKKIIFRRYVGLLALPAGRYFKVLMNSMQPWHILQRSVTRPFTLPTTNSRFVNLAVERFIWSLGPADD